MSNGMERLYEVWEKRSESLRGMDEDVRRRMESGEMNKDYWDKIDERDKSRWEENLENIKKNGGWINGVFYKGKLSEEMIEKMGGNEEGVIIGD